MKLTIGMAACGDFPLVWATVQSLRWHHREAFADGQTEIVIVDQSDDDALKNFVNAWAHRQVRRIEMKEPKGTSAPRNAIFEHARGEWVLVIDSHVLLGPGVVARFKEWGQAHPNCRDLLHGPMIYDSLDNAATHMADEWRGHMWGTWAGGFPSVEADPFDIPGHGIGALGLSPRRVARGRRVQPGLSRVWR